MFESLLRLGGLCISLWGYVTIFSRYLHFPKAISWIAVCCLHILVLSFAAYGGTGWLSMTSKILFIIGLSFFCWWVFRCKPKRWSLFQYPMMLWFYGYFFLMVMTLLSSRLVHYDNFSHWATIVKFLFVEDRLPSATDTIISFTSYPIGSSLFLVHVTRIAGYHEYVLLIGQLLLLFSCMVSFFVTIRDLNRKLAFAMLFTCLALFNYFNIAVRMNNLLVDFLLPLLTLSGFAGLFALRGKLKQSIIYFILIGGTLGIIKNSGFFFLLCLALYFLFCQYRYGGTSRKKLRHGISGIIAIGVSLIPLILWQNHIKDHFSTSKHEVSVSAYKQIFGEKDPTILHQITDLFMKTIFDPQTLSTQGVLLIQFLMITIWAVAFFYLKKKTPFLKQLILLDVIFIAYYAGIYGMFLFSMPTDEALTLAGFDRYASSIVILNSGLATFFLVRGIDCLYHEQSIDQRNYRSFSSLLSKKIYQYTTLILLFFATLMVLSENNGMRFNNQDYKETVQVKIAEIAGDHFTMNQQRYLIVSTDKSAVDSYLVGYVGKYYLFSPNVDGRENFLMSATEFESLLAQYDFVVILEEHYTFNAMTEKLYSRTFKPGIYSVDEIIQN